MEKDHLFVYGTLLDNDNEFAIYIKNNCRFYTTGKFKGRLYDIGEYPGAIADGNYPGYVYGSVFTMSDPNIVLKYLDDYEGFGHEQEQPNLFIREIVKIACGEGTISCWCYLYNLPVDGLPLIISGDYLRDR